MRRLRITLCIISLATLITTIESSAFTVSPMSINISYKLSKNNNSIQLIKNESNLPIAISVSLVKRDVLPNGVEKLTDASEDLIVFPPLLVIPGKGQKTIKITYIGKDIDNMEKNYRVTTIESPIDMDPITKGNNSVKMKVAYASPLYVSPPDAKSNLMATISKNPKTGFEIKIANKGNKHQGIKGAKVEIENPNNPNEIITLENSDLKAINGQNILAMHNLVFVLKSKNIPSWVTDRSKVRLFFEPI